MTTPSNNDRPSETPMISRQKLYEILPQMVAIFYGDIRHADGTELTYKEKQDFADAVANRSTHELAKAAAYDEAMKRLQEACEVFPNGSTNKNDWNVAFIKAEIASGRFKP